MTIPPRHNRARGAPVAALYLLWAVGCATLSHHVAETDLALIDEQGRASLAEPEAGLLSAQAGLGTALDQHRAAERQMNIAELMVEREVSQRAIAELRFSGAQESKDADQLLAAKDAKTAAETHWATSIAHLTHREAMEEYAQAQVDSARRTVDVAQAALEMARFAAVSLAKNLTEQETAVQKTKFGEQVAAAQLAKAKAETAVARHGRRVEEVAPTPETSAPTPEP